MQLDDNISQELVSQGIPILKAMRGRKTPLDVQLDAIPSRPLAHVCEEALRTAAKGRGLWRFDGRDESLIGAAIKSLISWAPAVRHSPRTRLRTSDGPGDV